ncbi:uncharacterized protein L201_002286 [Kwoniella dendrophila CBS 6074]|uniref:SET domain-containing protein n=1 Tax=Kwoniella dendrophila CBS 6074 TaxID=1295534 RepID=A0AAX4JPR0_9TREE
MNSSAEAGPSRPSPPRHLPTAIQSSATDIVMEDVSNSVPLEPSIRGGEPDDAVALLLNISSAVDVPPILPPKPNIMEVVMEDQARLVEKHAPPDTHTYPYTPPEDNDPNDSRHEPATVPPPTASLSNILTTPSNTDNSSPAAHPPTPTRTSPDPPIKQKGKRKRNTTGGSSRRASSDHPAHYMGEDNTVIRCICGFTEDDGFTIQCEGCWAWEHGICFGFMDEASAPDKYFCELCQPRPFDAAAAKRMQIAMQDQQRQAREAATIEGGAGGGEEQHQPIEKEKPRSKSSKTKRARTESALEGDLDKDKEQAKESSPGVMGPPATKPKRRQPGPKPRAKQPNNNDSSTPGPLFKEQQPILEEPEDDYFRIEPWTLEYTPIKENIVRGVAARQIMRNVYKEWVDAEEEIVAAKSRAIHNPSGLPSPTETGILRLSPDNLFPPPDFHILAPPVPPVFLSGSDLESLASPISIRAIEDAPSFLPLTYAENISKHGVYTRPTIYSVFAEEPITFGSFVGEFKGEVIDCQTYRKDPINQYSSLGLPKPHVRSIGPPINLMIDARGYGNDLRFVRSGCHPNVVLRPLLWRPSENGSLKLKFGLFASKDIGKKDELVLGWEWDDQHVVHSLRSIINTAMLNDGSLASPIFSASTKVINQLSNKIDSVLTHIFGTFTACACVIPGTCALAQMSQLVQPNLSQDPNDHEGENGRGKKLRVDLGELVGAVRGWRRRELEIAEMKKWKLNENENSEHQAFDLGLTRISSSTSEAHSIHSQSIHSEDRSVSGHEDNHEGSSEKAADESMDQDIEVEEQIEELQQLDQQVKQVELVEPEIVKVPEVPEIQQTEEEDLTMQVEESATVAEPHHGSEPELSVNAPVSVLPAAASPVPPPAPELVEPAEDLQIQQPESTTTTEAVMKAESPISVPKESSPAVSPKTPKSGRQDSSSSLSSAISSIKPSLADDMESGSESDATTATIPKSQFSESDHEAMTDEEGEHETESSPLRQSIKANGNARKVRRVLSPVLESSKFMNGHSHEHDISEDERELIIKKPKKNKVKIPDSSPKSASKSIKSITINPTTKGLQTSKAQAHSLTKKHRGGKSRRILLSSPSGSENDDEDENEDGHRMDNDGSASSHQKKKRKVSRDIGSSPKSGKSIKLEQLEILPTIPITSSISIPNNEDNDPKKEEPRAVVPDQITAPLSSAMDIDEAAIPNPQIVPPADSQSVPDEIVEANEPESELQPQPRKATPPLKEPTPPPKEPTPPPEPPKKVSLSDYLKSHKIRKESQTPISEVPPKLDVGVTAATATLAETPKVNGGSSFDDIPGFGNIASSTNTIISSPIKGEPETPTMGGKLNLLEHLPSNRSVSGTATSTSLNNSTPVETSRPTSNASSYVPRSVSGTVASASDYFPVQPQPSGTTAPLATSASSSFVPRVSSSYIPRQSSIAENDLSPATSLGLTTNSYVPRSSSSISTEESLNLNKSPVNQPTEMPPPLPMRELPPHTSTSTTSQQPPTTPSSLGSTTKLPPTGPKVPPTGPRAIGSLPGTPSLTSRIGGINGDSPSGTTGLGGYRGGVPGSGSERGRGFGGRGLWRGSSRGGGGYRGSLWRGS